MRHKIIAGNWKMNNDREETKTLINSLNSLSFPQDLRVMVAPSYIHLSDAVEMVKDSNLEVLAQNMHFLNNGAFTGEVSVKMLKSIGVNKVILGHSERRIYYNENDDSLKEKIKIALENNFEIIFCFGEQLSDRKNGKHFEVIEDQLSVPLFHLQSSNWKNIILAYEPVWAIGSGLSATPEDAQDVHEFIRSMIKKLSKELAESTQILYGGSVNINNAKKLFSMPDIDGGLIGGASLDSSGFLAIAKQ